MSMSAEYALIREIKGVGEKTEALFNKLNIHTIEDLIYYLPRTYYSYEEPVAALSAVSEGQRKAFLIEIKKRPSLKKGRVSVTILRDTDKNGIRLEAIWFNMPYLRSTLEEGKTFVLYGTIKSVSQEGIVRLDHPEIYTIERYREMMKSPQGVYPLTKGLSNNLLRKTVRQAFESFPEFIPKEFVPQELIKSHDLPLLKDALFSLHFPESEKELMRSKKRISYNDFLLFLIAAKLSQKDEEYENTFTFENREDYEKVLSALPYELTEGQKKALLDITGDFSGNVVTERLIQGDVGSGKTLIAFLSMLLAVSNGYKALLMAPTEVLSKQHLITFQKYIEDFSLPYEAVLLNSDVKGKERKETLQKIKASKGIFIIGTSALITEAREYEDVALVITDEQHRFGVKQRKALMDKGLHPFSILLSATPIPRTLARILYENMKITVVSDRPMNRLPIKNCCVKPDKRRTSYSFIEKEIRAGHQCYVICPFVEGNDEKPDVCDVMSYEKKLKEVLPSDIRTAVLHGRMKDSEKNRIMQEFYEKKSDILISTTVIEVGIDVPNATVIMIENADRFGLAQLHQLRGRVGRGSSQSFCIFMDCSDKDEINKKLSVINSSNDGFYIAEQDLMERGPGDLTGVRQSGDMGLSFSIEDIAGNSDTVKEAASDADTIIKADPGLSKKEHEGIKALLDSNEKKLYKNL